MYASTEGEPLQIAVEIESSDSALIVMIEDNGRQFDPTQVAPPAMASSLDDAKIGDIGIHLMRSFASQMRYERRNGRNRLTLGFVESQRSAQPAGGRP
jgi:anti-sigma regulatory factor (Ser/Thr protein kinase)